MGTREQVLAIAEGEVGYSRWNDPEAGTKYGRWYADWADEPYFGESGVPYCAMFTSWVLWQANVTAPGLPGAYVPSIVSAFKDAGRTPYNEDAQPGDLVMFDWQGDGVSDHIGIVYENCPSDGGMWTIEGNTSNTSAGSQSNGGCVAKRWRGYGSICLIGTPYYEVEPSKEDDMTEEQANWLWTCMNQLTSGYDPTGRNVNLNDHDHLKWIAAKQATDHAMLVKICEKLGIEVEDA